METRIFVGLGGNIPSAELGPPAAVLSAALNRMDERGIGIVRRSRWFHSAPVPPSDQPWYTNGVAEIRTALPPHALLAVLLAIETAFGRVRDVPNESRIIDLDLLAYGNVVLAQTHELILPHPRLHHRAFVLQPLSELAADWRHPVLGRTVAQLLADLEGSQMAVPLAGS